MIRSPLSVVVRLLAPYGFMVFFMSGAGEWRVRQGNRSPRIAFSRRCRRSARSTPTPCARGSTSVYPRKAPDAGCSCTHATASAARSGWAWLMALKQCPLKKARDQARAYQAALAAGEDPWTDKKKAKAAAKIPTFGEFADAFIEEQAKGFRNAKHVAQWKMTMKVYAKRLRGMQVDRIETSDVLAVLRPIWTKSPRRRSAPRVVSSASSMRRKLRVTHGRESREMARPS